MLWNNHYDLRDAHAFLSPSKYHWINYDTEKIRESYLNHLAALKGTETHDFAQRCIKRGQNLPRNKNTLNLFVNDAVGYAMRPEQRLFYSSNCHGTTDAISFRNNTLRVHDLKTGRIPAHMEQLYTYAAIFCLEYGKDPSKINTELRIYQNNDILITEGEADYIRFIMDQIVEFDKEIELVKAEEA